MGVLYRADYTNRTGNEYRIEVIDTQYSGAVLDIDVTTPGYELTYQGDVQDRINPILPSKCVIVCKASLADADFQTFINALPGADEERFLLAIYKKDTTFNLSWIGYILTDLVQDTDTSPIGLLTLTAVDGIARLKDVLYKDTDALFSDSDTVLNHLFKVIDKIGLTAYFSDILPFLKTAVDWYDNFMYTTSPADTLDPLTRARLSHNNFIYTGKDNLLHAKNCYEVLEGLCLTFGAQFKISGGQYRFIQPNQLYNSTFKSRTYLSDKSLYAAISNEDFRLIEPLRADGTFTHLRALGKVNATYEYKQGTNQGNFLAPLVEENTLYALEAVEGGDGQDLILNGWVHEFFVSTEIPEEDRKNLRQVYEFTLRVGAYYFTNKNGFDEWTTSEHDKYIIKSQYKISFGFNVYRDMSFIATDIPADGLLYFNFTMAYFEDEQGVKYTAINRHPYPDALEYDATFNLKAKDFELKILKDTLAPQEGKVEFSSINTSEGITPVKSNSIHEIKTLKIADGPDAYSTGRLEIWNGLTWNNSSIWKVGGNGQGFSIGNLVTREFLAGQKTPVRIFTGTVNGNIEAHNVIVFGIEHYILMDGTCNADQNSFTGTWYKALNDNTNIELADKVQYSEDVKKIISTVGSFEPVFSKNTAFNKNFGTGASSIARGNDSRIVNGETAHNWGDHGTIGYEPGFTKKTAFNKDFGILAGTIAQGDDSRIVNGQSAFNWGNWAEGVDKDFVDDLGIDYASLYNKNPALEYIATRVLVSTAAGRIGESMVTSMELSYLSGVTGDVQTQLNNIATGANFVPYSGATGPFNMGVYGGTFGGNVTITTGSLLLSNYAGLYIKQNSGTHRRAVFVNAVDNLMIGDSAFNDVRFNVGGIENAVIFAQNTGAATFVSSGTFGGNLMTTGNLTAFSGEFTGLVAVEGDIRGRTYPYTTRIGAGADATSTLIRAGSTAGLKSYINLYGGTNARRLDFGTSSVTRYIIDAAGHHDFKSGNAYFLGNVYAKTGAIVYTDRLRAYTGNLLILLSGGSNVLRVNGRSQLGGKSQFNARVSARAWANAFEWGHVNNAGYGNVLGHRQTTGQGYIAFNGSAGAVNNTITTNGRRASVFMGDLLGGFHFANVANANAANQSMQIIVAFGREGNIYTAGSISSAIEVTAYSDIRLKTKTGTVRSVLEAAPLLDVFLYTRKDIENSKEFIGGAAQNIQKFYPQAVTWDNDKPSVNYAALAYAIAVKGFQEVKPILSRHDQELLQNKQEINRLKSKVKTLENRLSIN